MSSELSVSAPVTNANSTAVNASFVFIVMFSPYSFILAGSADIRTYGKQQPLVAGRNDDMTVPERRQVGTPRKLSRVKELRVLRIGKVIDGVARATAVR